MDSTSNVLFILAIGLVSINISAGQGCGGTRPGWSARPLTDRARQAQTIVYGSVRGIYQGVIPTEYNVEMDIKCVLKGTARTTRTNITEIGADCVDSAMRKGISYIVFVTVTRDGRGQSRYVTHDVNEEMGANRATKENFAAVRQSGVTNQCNTATFEPNEEPFGTGNNGNGNRNGGGGGGGASALAASSLCIFIASLYSLTF